MPMYEYTCAECGKEAVIVMTLKEHESGPPPCPSCGSKKMKQRFSSFIAQTEKKS